MTWINKWFLPNKTLWLELMTLRRGNSISLLGIEWGKKKLSSVLWFWIKRSDIFSKVSFKWNKLWQMDPFYWMCLKCSSFDKKKRLCPGFVGDVMLMCLSGTLPRRSACIQMKMPLSHLLNRAMILMGLPLKAAISFFSRAAVQSSVSSATANHICSMTVFMCGVSLPCQQLKANVFTQPIICLTWVTLGSHSQHCISI